jgi:tRNA threonylcarbamoyladenosine biosynthesis protein TsaB
MLVLALDTTTRAGSCALARDGVVVCEQASDESRPQATRLPAELMALLERERVALGDVDLFAVATGPGSFTGLRIGIATMQGLAFAERKGLIGVSALDALAVVAAASLSTPADRIATWVDAWRGEVYAALYENGREVQPPTVESPQAVLDRLGETGGRTAFIGDGAHANARLILEAAPSATIVEPAMPRIAGTIATLATSVAQHGGAPPPHAIRPLYVRRPDAELARDARAHR